MDAVELLHDNASPGEAGDVRRTERERLDRRHEAGRVVGQAKICRHIRGAARARLVPGDYRELVWQGGELRLPHAAVLSGAVHEHHRRPVADARVGDLESVRPDDLHPRKPTPAWRRLRSTALATASHAEELRELSLFRDPCWLARPTALQCRRASRSARGWRGPDARGGYTTSTRAPTGSRSALSRCDRGSGGRPALENRGSPARPATPRCACPAFMRTRDSAPTVPTTHGQPKRTSLAGGEMRDGGANR